MADISTKFQARFQPIAGADAGAELALHGAVNLFPRPHIGGKTVQRARVQSRVGRHPSAGVVAQICAMNAVTIAFGDIEQISVLADPLPPSQPRQA